jgi:YopX protein
MNKIKMRQFKFRAWHKERKIMKDFTFNDLMSRGAIPCICFNEKIFVPVCSSRIKIMQYVGNDCVDCHGIEICEGDILKFDYFDKMVTVGYSEGCFFTKVEMTCWFPLYDCPPGKKEIIGNIHQNLELINVKIP